MTVFCDNGDCFYIDEDGFCDCDKLSIVGGVCAGSYRSGRNACDGDVDERLKAENAKLREELEAVGIAAYLYGRDDIRAENDKPRRAFNETLIRLVAANDVAVSNYMDDEYLELLRELGIEVDE